MTSDDGDWVGGRPAALLLDERPATRSARRTHRTPSTSPSQTANGAWWHVDLAAPAGETLAAKTYASATRYPFQDPSSPGLSVGGDGRGCNTLTGSFTVSQVSFQTGGTIDSLDATFEQHCEGADPALRGELHLVDAAAATADCRSGSPSTRPAVRTSAGTATVRGTVTCNSPTTVNVSGTLTQKATRFAVATGQFYRSVACSGTTRWEATVAPNGSVPFNSGAAQAARPLRTPSTRSTGASSTTPPREPIRLGR